MKVYSIMPYEVRTEMSNKYPLYQHLNNTKEEYQKYFTSQFTPQAAMFFRHIKLVLQSIQHTFSDQSDVVKEVGILMDFIRHVWYYLIAKR